MVTVFRARRRSAVLTPSSLACLSVMPTINLTAGCLHGCAYCYTRGYGNYPGDGRIVLYEDTLARVRDELSRRQSKPRSVYFSPSSDLFQPAPEVLELGHALLEFLLGQGIGVAFLTKGRIPSNTLRLLIDHADLVRAQIGLVTLDESISSVFEPQAAAPAWRLRQMEALIAGGVGAEARLDPILPALTDREEALDQLFEALSHVAVRKAAAGVLFLRPALVESLRAKVSDRALLGPLLDAYGESRATGMRGSPWPIQNLPTGVRREILVRVQRAAQAHDIELRICACKNPDLARGSCKIAGTWASQSRNRVQPLLVK